MNSARRQATRRKLYQAAVTLIAEQGFSSTTVDEIAERAGVAKGTVYYNFASKTELFEELLRHGVGMLATSLREATVARRQAGHRVDALDAVLRAVLDFVAAHPAFCQLLAAELWRTNRPWQPTLLAVRQQALSVVADALRDAVDDGELPRDLDVHLTASALFGLVLVAALDWQAFQPERSPEEVHAALSGLVRGRLRGAAADDPVAAPAGWATNGAGRGAEPDPGRQQRDIRQDRTALGRR